VVQAGESFLLSASLMEYGLWMAGPFARLATRLRLSPDALSWGSLLFHFAAAAALAGGRFTPAVWLLLLGGACDSLDGSVARARGLSSNAGEVLDAVIDRWSEMAVFFGLAYHYRDSDLGLGLSLFAAAGSLMVSYTRAKAQAMGVGAAGGFMQRHERAAYLIAAVLVAALLESWNEPHARVPAEEFPLSPADWPIFTALALIGFFATVASLQRTARMRAALRKKSA
jgi:phosphatidylglycerophosphate synthase